MIDAEERGYFLLSNSFDAMQMTDVFHVIEGEFAAVVRVAALVKGPTLAISIRRVVGGSSEKEMRRVAATPVIAFVAHEYFFAFNDAVRDHPSDA